MDTANGRAEMPPAEPDAHFMQMLRQFQTGGAIRLAAGTTISGRFVYDSRTQTLRLQPDKPASCAPRSFVLKLKLRKDTPP